MKKNASTIFLIIIFFIGLSLLLYPPFSNYWNTLHSSRAIMDYDSVLQNMRQEDYTAIFDQADEYNRKIRKIAFPFMYYDKVEGYQDILNVSGTGIMGYISIPQIGVELPIYHGTSDTVLASAVGHLEGSSLPVGGSSTHCVLSAHRGLPSAKLFTDLDELIVGDTFIISVLDRTLTYEVDQILIVEPKVVEDLYVVEDMDYCTLVTCTPYGINTHRMLVRGHRIENTEEARVVRVSADAIKIEPLIVMPFVALPILLVLLIGLMIPKPKKNRRKEV